MRTMENALLMVSLSTELVEQYDLHAGNIIKKISSAIRGGGGGQPHFAKAGGKHPGGLDEALSQARSILAAKN